MLYETVNLRMDLVWSAKLWQADFERLFWGRKDELKEERTKNAGKKVEMLRKNLGKTLIMT